MIDSNIDKNSDTYSEKHNVFRNECIVAQKVYDQCRSQGCIKQGPVISNEKCECIIVNPEYCTHNFGRIIWPGKPIRLPEWVKSIKYLSNSFQTKSITVLNIMPSPLKGYWDICIEFIFDFKLQLFGECMTPIEIICRPCDHHVSNDPESTKNYLCCSSVYVKQVTLFGTKEDAPMVASDILPQQDYNYNNSPHVLVQARAVPVEFKIISPDEACCYQDLFDDIYHEPFNYIYAYIAMLIDIKLFRFVCMLVDAKACKPAKICDDLCDDPCALFSKMDFPKELFQP